MQDRRTFLKAVGGIGAGLALSGLTPVANAQSARREITIGGKRVTTVDIHGHCAWPEVWDRFRDTGLPGDSMFSALALGPERIAAMDERGIDIQVLSINQFWYEADEESAAAIVKMRDELLSAWVKEHPDRFVALSSAPVQFPELAADHLEYAVNELGIKGATLGGHVLGERLSDTKYDPFWRKAEELNAPVFIHPRGAGNVIREDGWDGSGALDNIIGNPLETAIFLANMINDGVLDRFPGLKICAAHGGGYMPSYLGRFEVACDVRPDAGCKNSKPPSEYLKSQVLLDSMVFSDEGLRHLVAEVGASQVIYGTDIPYNWPDTLDLILDADYLTNGEKEAIVGGNLVELLGIL